MRSVTQTFHVFLWQRRQHNCALKTSPAGGFKQHPSSVFHVARGLHGWQGKHRVGQEVWGWAGGTLGLQREREEKQGRGARPSKEEM